MSSHIQSTLDSLEQQHLLRTLNETTPLSPPYISQNNQKILSFASNDYLGLSQHPTIKQAAIQATETYGTGAGGSRYTTGNHPLYTQLETKLAALKHTDKAIIFGSGYLTHIGLIPSLVGRNDLVIADKLIHASIIDGIKLSGAKLMRFHHNDANHCKTLLKTHRDKHPQCLIITEHIFSMDGDKAPTSELYKLANQHNALLLTDDAHGFGVLPNWSAHDSHIIMGTLSKAIGAYGGYVCTNEPLASYIQQKARSLIYTTALPPATLASALAALELLEQQPEHIKTPLAHATYFTQQMNLPKAESAIVPYIIGAEQNTLALANQLLKENILVSAIRPPTVPTNTARLRITFSACHTQEHVDMLKHALT